MEFPHPPSSKRQGRRYCRRALTRMMQNVVVLDACSRALHSTVPARGLPLLLLCGMAAPFPFVSRLWLCTCLEFLGVPTAALQVIEAVSDGVVLLLRMGGRREGRRGNVWHWTGVRLVRRLVRLRSRSDRKAFSYAHAGRVRADSGSGRPICRHTPQGGEMRGHLG